MKKIALSVLSSVTAALLMASQPANGQTPPGAAESPTPTAAPSRPSGEDLLYKMFDTSESKGSVHVDGYSRTVELGTAQEIQKSQSDMSWKPFAMQMSSTTRKTTLGKKRQVTSVIHSQIVMAGNRAAARTSPWAWRCISVGDFGTAMTSLVGELLDDPRTSIRVTNLGLEALDGVTVWHVRTIMTIPGVMLPNQPATADDYIAQSDYARIRATTKFVFQYKDPDLHLTVTIRYTTSDNYSRYGEPVKIEVPEQCREQVGNTPLLDSRLPPDALRLAASRLWWPQLVAAVSSARFSSR
jgi:hypothetical protein